MCNFTQGKFIVHTRQNKGTVVSGKLKRPRVIEAFQSFMKIVKYLIDL